jgi:hypothetical protein
MVGLRGWAVGFIAGVMLSVVSLGSGHDWYLAVLAAIMDPWYWPLFVADCGMYFFFGLGVGLLCRRFVAREPILSWLLILLTCVALRLGLWEAPLLVFSVSVGRFLLFAGLGNVIAGALPRSRGAVVFGVIAVTVTMCLAEVHAVRNFIATRGTYLQYWDHWDEWRDGRGELPAGWEFNETDGLRYIVRDSFISRERGYIYAPGTEGIPKEGPFRRLLGARSLPGGWYEFVTH